MALLLQRMYKDTQRLEYELMNPLRDLAESFRGSYDETLNSSASKVPVVSMPHGLVTDAGYSLALMLCTGRRP